MLYCPIRCVPEILVRSLLVAVAAVAQAVAEAYPPPQPAELCLEAFPSHEHCNHDHRKCAHRVNNLTCVEGCWPGMAVPI
jgi:hypothetical protein